MPGVVPNQAKNETCCCSHENINERLYNMRLRDEFRNKSLINVHALIEKTAVVKVIKHTLEVCPRYDFKIIFGNFNGPIRTETIIRQYIGSPNYGLLN